MKLNKLIFPMVLALAAVLASTGCKKGITKVTPLPGQPPAIVSDQGGAGTIAPGPGGQIGGGDNIGSTGVPTAAPGPTRSATGRGLAEVKVRGATLVVYAAKDGQVALDGEGGNSPFAVAMIQRIVTPGVEINKIFRLVRDDVMEATAGRQEPYTYGSLPGSEDFFFVAK